MDKLGDVVMEHHCHQPLECGGGITVPLLHHLTHESAEYGGSRHNDGSGLRARVNGGPSAVDSVQGGRARQMWAGEHDEVQGVVSMRACRHDVDDAWVTDEWHATWMWGQLWSTGCNMTCKDRAGVQCMEGAGYIQKGQLAAETYRRYVQKEGPMGDTDEGSCTRHSHYAWGWEPSMARGICDNRVAMVAWTHNGDRPWRTGMATGMVCGLLEYVLRIGHFPVLIVNLQWWVKVKVLIVDHRWLARKNRWYNATRMPAKVQLRHQVWVRQHMDRGIAWAWTCAQE